MGKIKSNVIKRTSKELMNNKQFTDKFEENKEILKPIIEQKKSRNQIAGYIARLKQQEKNDRNKR